MLEDKYWNDFCRSGRIEDYLKYKNEQRMSSQRNIDIESSNELVGDAYENYKAEGDSY